MEGLAKLIDTIYDRFFLLDILAKVFPGLILLASLSTAIVGPGKTLKFASSAGFVRLFLVLCASWTAALAIQGTGELAAIVEDQLRNERRCWCWRAFGRLLGWVFGIRYAPVGRPQSSDQRFQKDMAQLDKVAVTKQMQRYHRNWVVMEASGNTSLSLMMAYLILLASRLFRPVAAWSSPDISRWWLLLETPAVVLALSPLRFFYRRSITRLHLYVKGVTSKPSRDTTAGNA